MLTKEQWNLRLGMYKSGMIDFEDIYSTIAEHCGEASNSSKPLVSGSLELLAQEYNRLNDVNPANMSNEEKLKRVIRMGNCGIAILLIKELSANDL